METKVAVSQPTEKKPMSRARRSRRRYARELQGFAFREICDQFEMRGPDSDIDLSEAFEAQRPSVMSILIHDLYRRLRRVESRQATAAVVSINTRKGVAA